MGRIVGMLRWNLVLRQQRVVSMASLTFVEKLVAYESELYLKLRSKDKVSPCQRYWLYLLPCGACTAHMLVTCARVHVPM